MKERLKELRLSLGLSQSDFGNKIFVQKGHVSSMENGTRNITERTIMDICREFDINEDWLKYGIGEMFNTHPENFVDELAQKYQIGDSFKGLISNYLKANEFTKKVIDDFLDSFIASNRNDEDETKN